MSLPQEWQPDPITTVYRAIRVGLLAHQGFFSLVKNTGHFPDMSDVKFEKFKENVGPGDLPESCLWQSKFRLRLFGRNSMTAEIEQAFDAIFTVDTLSVLTLNAMKFNALIALSALGADLGVGSLVRDWDITDGADDPFGQLEWKRDTLRYVSAFRVATTLSVPRQTLAELYQPA